MGQSAAASQIMGQNQEGHKISQEQSDAELARQIAHEEQRRQQDAARSRI